MNLERRRPTIVGKEFNLENIDIKGEGPDIPAPKTNWLLILTVAASLATLYMFAKGKNA